MYQVFARKLRPQTFDGLVGQEHVVRALTHALDSGRLHHAYLFTGTRGVGKTTIARILAKCLNCERGVSSKPCGECSACVEIGEGRFIDLIEVDAASRTKVDDTRDLLDNVQYLPTRGRFKVYLIDEVHMLSTASFNALLKTLEEPPEHVKFLLATTDPRKVPVTVLSRCLQFQLKNLLAERIAGYLRQVLDDERIVYDAESLDLIARAGRGSMRDALSILDQAIAFGGGKLVASDVGALLGSVERQELEPILEALAQNDGARLLALCDGFGERAADFKEILNALLGALHDVAVAQLVPSRAQPGLAERFASAFDAERVQLFYQIVLIGLRDFTLAPDPKVALEMTLLRMLAFDVDGDATPAEPDAAAKGRRAARPRMRGTDAMPQARDPDAVTSEQQAAQPSAIAAPAPESTAIQTGALDWFDVVPTLKLGGVARMLAEHSVLVRRDDTGWVLCLDRDHDTLLSDNAKRAIERAIGEHVGRAVPVAVNVGVPESETPARRKAREATDRHQRAIAALKADDNVRALLAEFGAEIKLDTVRPVTPP